MARAGGRPQPTITDDRALSSAKIERSLRFNSSDTSVLYRTPSSASNRQTWTFSTWLKSTDPANGSYQTFFSSNKSNYSLNGTYLWFYTTGELGLSIGSGTYYLKTTAKFRDSTCWYHVVAYVDTTQGTASDRVKLYVNGEEQTDLANATYPTQDYSTQINNTTQHTVGARRYSSIDTWFNGYLAETNFIDGYAYDPSYFGFTDPQTGIWMPKRYEGTYGTNGFYLDYSDNSSTAALGIDKSPNGNDFTTYNVSVTAGVGNDSFEDTPSNNFCTLNPLYLITTGANISNGNLDYKSDSNYSIAAGNFTLKTGKWYWEVTITAAMSGGNGQINGIVRGEHPNSNAYVSYDTNGNVYGIGYVYNGSIQGASPDGSTNAPGGASGLATYTEDDVLGFASDIANGTLALYKNGSLQHTITGLNSYDWFPAGSGYGTSSTCSFNFGQRPFVYTPPVGHSSLCSNNLSLSTSIIKPQKFFDTLLWTGNATSRNITGLDFKPDLVWVKNRDSTYHHGWFDVVRGANKVLKSSATSAEATFTQQLMSFNDGGFSLGDNSDSGNYVNLNSDDYVAWCWRAGGNSNTFNIDGVGYATAAAAGLDGGAATPTGASVNTKAGFSILKYNGTADQSISHGLSKAPELTIEKELAQTTYWTVTTTAIDGSLDYLYLNTSDQKANYTVDLPTSSLVDIGRNNECIMYMWHSVPGYSKIGSYSGNANSDGVYVHLGFKPAWLLVKRVVGSGNGWTIVDNKRNPINSMKKQIYPNLTYADSTYDGIDFLSNGFKMRQTNAWVNTSSTYLYMAFAETPEATPFDTFPNAR